MRNSKNIKWLPILMGVTILAIAAFQFYWLSKAYEREERTLDMRTNFMFRETVRSLQSSKLKLDRFIDTAKMPPIILRRNKSGEVRIVTADPKVEGMIDIVTNKMRDSAANTLVFSQKITDSLRVLNRAYPGKRDRMLQFLFDIDSLQDPVTVEELDSAFAKRMVEQNLEVQFDIKKIETREAREPIMHEVTLGLRNPVTYKLELLNKTAMILKRIAAPILFTLFLLAFTVLSFLLLYKNLLRQHKLADIKNDFISNITHELKTPIATVSVAIEALRSFNASIDPQRTKEYLDISANELQRLSLLVDKVLKLSMFEKREIELQYELLDMQKIVEEVTSSLRLQFEKHHAKVNVVTNGNTSFEGDRLHMVSVVFNLLDNAIKYSADAPHIDIQINGDDSKVDLVIKDSGIGIPAEFQGRIFEKFFRVPTGNLHNAKGYGLGLSYVAHVINRHHGTIKVESIEGDGSQFIIRLPKHTS